MYILFIQREKTILQWAFELNSALAAVAGALQMKGYATAYKTHKRVQGILIFCGHLERENTTCSEFPFSREFPSKRNNLNRG